MQRCANDHPPIEHDEFYCPLCAAIEDSRAVVEVLDLMTDDVRVGELTAAQARVPDALKALEAF